MYKLTVLCLILVFIATGHGITRKGAKSGTKDDDPSTVNCVGDEFVISCKCENGAVCDGGLIAKDGKSCTVRNTLSKPGVVAEAECEVLYQLIVSDVAKSPVVSCPAGLKLKSCLFNNPWIQTDLSSNAAVNGNGCKTTCAKCQVTAVCVRQF